MSAAGGSALLPTPPCASVAPLLSRATSSASVLLYGTHSSCRPAPFEALVLRLEQSGSMEWRAHTQLGYALPIELGSLQCPSGCYFRLRALNASAYAVRTMQQQGFNASELERDQAPPLVNAAESALSALVVTPRSSVELPHPPAARLHFFLQPPLAPPLLRALEIYTRELAASISDSHFQVREGRILPVETSTTGAFVQIDVHPEDLYTTNSGPDVPRIIQKLALHAATLRLTVPPARAFAAVLLPADDSVDSALTADARLSHLAAEMPEETVAAVYGTRHHIDPRFGLWRQAVPATATHSGWPRLRLWPRLHSVAAAATRAGAAAVASRPAPSHSAEARPQQGGGLWGRYAQRSQEGGRAGGVGGGVEADNLKASDGWLPFDDDGDDGDELDQVLDHSLVLTSGELEHELERELDIDGTREEWLLKAVVVSLSILFALHLIRRAWPTIGPHLRHRWLMCDSRACLHRCTARLLSALAGGGRAGGGRAHEHRPLRISAEGMSAEGQLSPTSEPTTPRGPEALAAEAAAERAWLEDWLQRSKASAFHH